MVNFKSFERYILTDDGYQLVSERTSAKDIIFNDGRNLEDAMGGISIKVVDELPETGTEGTVYFTYE